MKYDVSVLAVFKNEESFLPEWIQHYFDRGVDHLYLLNDNSTDDSVDIILSHPEKERISLRSVRKEDTEIKIHWRQELLYNKYFGRCLQETKWLGVFDLDEFCYSPKEKDLKKVLSSYEDFQEIVIEWYWFGSNGFKKQPKKIVDSFNKRSKWLSRFIVDERGISRLGYQKDWCCKSFAKTENIASIRHHYNRFVYKGTGYQGYDPKIERPFSHNASAQGEMFINHYVGSKDYYFENKVKRGSCNNNLTISENKEITYHLINLNEIEDNRLREQNNNNKKDFYMTPSLKKKKVYILQNTEYHFETAISLYKLFEDLGYETSLYRGKQVDDKNLFKQKDFIREYSLRTVEELDSIEENDSIGVVATAYPSTLTNEFIPGHDDPVFNKITNLLYISHRFHNHKDYSGIVNRQNSFCLSPLSRNIGVDHIWLVNSPIIPKYSFSEKLLRITMQGHFELVNRRGSLLKLLEIRGTKPILMNILGTKMKNILNEYKIDRDSPNKIMKYEFISELDFYRICNTLTSFILPAIDGEIKGGTYARERFSSNFNLAYVLEKPIFAHEIFKEIYKIPGIYYNYSNIKEKFKVMLEMKKEEYKKLVEEFNPIKKEMMLHNAKVIEEKINNLEQK